MRTDKNNIFEFTIKFLMTLDRSYIGYLGCLGTGFLKGVLMSSNGTICLIKLLFKMGLFTVYFAPDTLPNFPIHEKKNPPVFFVYKCNSPLPVSR